MTINYLAVAQRSFTKMGITPRNGQAQVVADILSAFYVDKKRNVILSADTGTGKSIIGAAVACSISDLEKDEKLVSFILMQNNALVDQYARTFSKYGEADFFQIKGANTYPCDALRKFARIPDANADSCVEKKVSDAVKENVCSSCEYKQAKKWLNSTLNLISNYSYYFVSKMWSGHLHDRAITIFDEAHTLNNIFCEHNAIHVTAEKLETYAKICEQDLAPMAIEQAAQFKRLKTILMQGKINGDNYNNFISALSKTYKECHKYAAKKVDEEQDMTTSNKYSKIAKMFFGLGCKIGDLLHYKYEHVFEYIDETHELSIKPVFIGAMSSVLLGPKNLFMSATISEELMVTTLDLDKSDTVFIKLPPVFPAENKSIVFYNPMSLNFEAMKKPETIKALKKSVFDIVTAHTKEQRERGIILTPSFYITDMLTQELSKIPGITIIAQTKGVKAADAIKKFKGHNGACVLISPSIYEGIDFPDDESRFQVIVKAPFASLAERRMKYIADAYPKIYRLETLMKIIQGIGRSVRSEDDYCVTYILDSQAKTMFNSSLNVWKDQFTVHG